MRFVPHRILRDLTKRGRVEIYRGITVDPRTVPRRSRANDDE